MAKNELINQAIADAKAVVESAAAYGKLTFEEAFAPKLQRMISSKLENDGFDDEEELDVDPIEGDEELPADDLPVEDDMPVDDEEDLDPEMEAIMKELEGEDDFGSEDDEMMEQDGWEGGEEKQLEQDEFGDGEEDLDPELEALMREIDDETGLDDEFSDDEEEIPMENSRRPMRRETARPTQRRQNPIVSRQPIGGTRKIGEAREVSNLKKDLREAYGVIQLLRKKFNEVNLLNSKLLYSSKIFKANNNLTEKQKIGILESFDRANTVREVKLLYSSLQVNLKKVARKPVRESFSSDTVASKQRIGGKEIINESSAITRLKQLAGLGDLYK